MADDVVFRPTFDDSEIRRAMTLMGHTAEEIEAKVQQMANMTTKSFEKVTVAATRYDESLQGVTATGALTEQQFVDLKVSIEEAGNSVESVEKKTQKAAKSKSLFAEIVQHLAGRVNILGVNLGFLIGKLQAQKTETDKVASSAGGLNKALMVLKSGGIYAVIAALVVGIALFAKFGSNIDATKMKIQGLKDRFAAWKSVMTPAIETIAMFAKGVGNVLKLDFDGAMEVWTKATAKWKNEVWDAQEAALVLISMQRALQFRETINEAAVIAVQRQLETAKALAMDTEESDGRRLVSLREYEKLQRQILEGELRQAESAKKLFEQQNKSVTVSKQLNEANKRIVEAQIALDELAREGEDVRRDITNKRLEEERKRREAEQKRLKEALEAYAKLVEKLGDQTDKALLSRLYDPEKLVLEREFAIAEVEKFITELMDAAKAAGTELPATFLDDFKVIFNAIDEELKRGLKEMTDKGLKEAGKNIQEFSERMAGQQLQALAKAQEDALLSIFDRTKKKLLGSLGLNEEQAAFILQSFGTVFNSIMQMQEAAVNAQLEQQNKLIEASRERISSLEQDVELERDLRRQGLASNLDDAKAALDAERAVLEAAQAKSLAIQRKAANQQLVINSILQASELALAAASIIKANSPIPVVGAVIAAAGIALIFSILAQAKANAARFSQVPKLRKGARLEGESHERGGVPLLVDGSKYYEAEGGEWLIGSAPSKKHDTFLQNLNAGRYDEMNLHALAEQARQRPIGQIITNIHATERKIQTLTKKQELLIMAAAHRQAADAAAEKMIEYWKTRPIDTPLDSPIKRETTVGHKKVIEIIKPQ